MTLLSARGLTKAFGAETLFRDLSISVTDGDRIGLLGINGSGKSTLLKVLAAEEPADDGVIDRRRGARISYLAQEPVLPGASTALEVASEGLSAWTLATARYQEVTRLLDAGSHEEAVVAEQAELAETVERLGGFGRDHLAHEYLTKLGISDTAQRASTMSGGERRRVALARLLVSQPDLAILDEPTNHLDTETIEWLEETLRGMKGAALLVTHDRYVLDNVATRILELDRGVLREFRGNYSDYLEQKAILAEHEGRVEANRQNLIRRELAWLRRGAKARSTKQKARIGRAEAVIAAPAPIETSKVKLESAAARTGKTILDLQDVTVDIGGQTRVQNLTLHLVSGDRIGIIGPNGAGKTSLLRVVTGDLAPTAGRVVVGAQTKIAYFDQARAGLVDDWSIFDNVAEREGAERTGGGVVRLGERELDLRTYLEQFLFEASKQRQKVGSLSGGERARVALAKMLKGGNNLLLLDEPTNDLDVDTLAALEEMLTSWGGAALVVTHDRYFLNRVATSVLAFERGSTDIIRYAGGYDDYRQTRQTTSERSPETRALSEKGGDKAAVPAREPRSTLTYAERLELEGIAAFIDAAEADLSRVEGRLADPSVYSAAGGSEGRTLEAERQRAADKVAQLTARWEALEAKKGTKG